MTKRSYPAGWFAGSKVRGIAPSPGDCAWGVYCGGGFSGWSSQVYDGFVRAVRASQSLDLGTRKPNARKRSR